MRARPAPRTFRSGELAPWLDGLSNEITQQGCRTLENFIVRKQGQAMRRPGTHFVNEVKDSADTTVLVPVTIDDDNSYVLELGDAYIRFYKNHARVTYSSTTTIYEVTSPWSTGDVSNLRWAYVPEEKSLFFACRAYAMRRLTWTADADWALNEIDTYSTKDLLLLSYKGQIHKTSDMQEWEYSRINALSPSGGWAFWHRVRRGKHNFIGITLDGGIVVSEDGETWTTVRGDAQLADAVVGFQANEIGEGLLVSTNAYMYRTEDDGLTWLATTAPTVTSLADFSAVGYDEIKAKWRVAGANAYGAYSEDMVTWTSVADTSVAVQINGLSGYDDLWVGVASNKIYSAASIAAGFVLAASITNVYFWDVCRGNPGGTAQWIAVGSRTSGTLAYRSADRTTWSLAYEASCIPSQFRSEIAWLGHRYIWTANGLKNVFFSSDDGISWTTHTLPAFYAGGPQIVAGRMGTQEEWFNQTNHYPHNLAYNEGRLVIGPTSASPSTLWASKIDRIRNFFLGEFSDEGWSYRIASERNVDIQWAIGNLGGLVIGTRTAEGILLGSPDEGITPNTAQFRWLSTFGSANVQPVRVNNAIVFVQRSGEVVRGYVPQANAYESPELTFYADHIGAGGLTSIDRQEDPQNLVYFIRADGQVPALTMETGMVAWTRIKAASTSLSVGIIESIAVIPTGGAEDEVWQIANRKVAAGTKRYIEYYDPLAVESLTAAHYVDCGVNPTASVTFAAVGALTHLAGEVVDALVDGTRWVAGLTVAASGTITVSPYSGTNIHAGLPYTSYLQTMRGDYGSPWGAGAGLNKRTSELLAWVHDSSALAKFGPTTTLATETISYPSSTTLVTDIVRINFPGQWDRDNYLWCIVTDPRPFTIVAMAPDSETGDR